MRKVYRVLSVMAIGLLAGALPASVTAAPQASVVTAARGLTEGYFNSLNTLQANFTQVQSDKPKEIQRGTFSANRPAGQFLWQYETPVKQKIVGTGTAVYYVDQSFKGKDGQVTQLPIDAGMGKLLRGEPLNLAKVGLRVTNYTEISGTRTVTLAATQTRRDQQGLKQVTLTFRGTAQAPVLKSFSATDMLGVTTTVSLTNLRTGVVFPKGQFSYTPPRQNVR